MARVAGALRLDDLGLLCFEGQDAAAFLQGYLTTDAEALGAVPAFTAMCNLKGRTVLTGYAWREGHRILLLLHRSLCPLGLAFLRPYLAFSKTRATDLSEVHAFVGAIGLQLGPSALNLDAERQVLLLERAADPTAKAAQGVQSSASLLPASAPSLSAEQWRSAAIERREVWLQAATSAAFLPQMLALDELGAVSFNKGCYLGQEVVARAQHRGDVKRRLTRLSWSGAAVSVGMEIRDGAGRKAGILVATAGADDAADKVRNGTALAVISSNATEPLAVHDGRTTLRTTPGAQGHR